MLDIRLIREQAGFCEERLATRGGEDAAKIDEVLRVDAERRKAETALQQLNADRKRLSKEIGGKRSRGEASDEFEDACPGNRRTNCALERTNATSEEEQKKSAARNSEFAACECRRSAKIASANPVVRSWGEKPALNGPVLDHVALGRRS